MSEIASSGFKECNDGRTKFFEMDLKPVCKGCYEKFPGELKKRLKKAYEEQQQK